jgi:hypothetical protein
VPTISAAIPGRIFGAPCLVGQGPGGQLPRLPSGKLDRVAVNRLLSTRLSISVNSAGVPSLSINRVGGEAEVLPGDGIATGTGGSAGVRPGANAGCYLPRNAHGHRLGTASTVTEWKEWIKAHWRSVGLGEDPGAPDEHSYNDRDFYGLG